MGFVLVNRYLDRDDFWQFRKLVTEGKMRKYDFSENPIRPHVKFRPQNDQLRADLPTWAPECRVMGSLGLFVPNYKKLDWTDFVLWPWENMKFLHSLLWEHFRVPTFQVYRRFSEMNICAKFDMNHSELSWDMVRTVQDPHNMMLPMVKRNQNISPTSTLPHGSMFFYLIIVNFSSFSRVFFLLLCSPIGKYRGPISDFWVCVMPCHPHSSPI